jgi:hypothetical protein
MTRGGREKRIIAMGDVAVALLLFYRFGLSPAPGRPRRLDHLVAHKARDLDEMRILHERYLAQQGLMEEGHPRLASTGRTSPCFYTLTAWLISAT